MLKRKEKSDLSLRHSSTSLTTIPEGGSAGNGRGASARLQGEELLKDPMAQLFGTVKVQVGAQWFETV